MQEASPSFRSHLTLALTTILHAFTHAYAVMLVPLYLLVQQVHLELVSSVSLIVTLYGLVYSLGSYAAGAMSDGLTARRVSASDYSGTHWRSPAWA